MQSAHQPPRRVGTRYYVTRLLKDGLLPQDIAEYAGCTVELVQQIEADILRACRRKGPQCPTR